MRATESEPGGSVPATGAGTGRGELVRLADPGASSTPSDPRRDVGDHDPVEVPTSHRTTAARRVPAAVIAGVDWVRLMELS